MQSHVYDFRTKDLVQLIGLPLIPAFLFVATMHLAVTLHLLPRPRPALDMDRTILIHQIEASRSRSDAEVLLLGDSSCLIDVSANQLTAEIVRPVLNLATFSYLDLNAQSVLLTNFIAANPNRLKAVVLLMHPEALRRESAASYYTNFVRRFLQGEDCFQPQNIRDRTSQALGLEIFRERIFCRIVPAPLHGASGLRFGLTTDFDKWLR